MSDVRGKKDKKTEKKQLSKKSTELNRKEDKKQEVPAASLSSSILQQQKQGQQSSDLGSAGEEEEMSSPPSRKEEKLQKTPKKKEKMVEPPPLSTIKKKQKLSHLKENKKKQAEKKKNQADEAAEDQVGDGCQEPIFENRQRQRKDKQLKVSLCEKFIISLLATFIFSLFFGSSGQSSSELLELIEEQSSSTFEIASQKVVQKIRFTISDSSPVFDYLPIHSIKEAEIEASLYLRLGFQVEKVNIVENSDGTFSYEAVFSHMKVLTYDIKAYEFVKKEDGYFNTWQIQEINEVEEHIAKNYLPQAEKKALTNLSDKKKLSTYIKTEQIISNLISSYESWFNRVLRSLNQKVDHLIFEYLPKIENSKTKKALNDGYIQSGKLTFNSDGALIQTKKPRRKSIK